MKTFFKVLPIVFLSTLASHTAQAEIEHETKKSIALVSSGIIGGLLGGPVGFIVAGVGGALVVDAVFDESSPQATVPPVIAEQVIPEAITTDDPFADEFEESASTTELTVISDSNIDEALVSSIDASETSLTPSSPSDSVQLSLLFDTNQDQLSYEMLDRIDDEAETIKEDPNSLIRIDGYADARGSEAYNQDLSYRRAQSVANYLIEQGVDRDRIIIRSMGESQSLAVNDEYGYAQDRKVELSLDRSLTASRTNSCEDASGAIDSNCESINQTDKLGHNLAELDDQLAQES